MTTTITHADATRAARRVTQRTRADVARMTGQVQAEATITVVGTPAPQGSKRALVNPHTGRANLIESSKKVKPWRAAVVHAWEDAGHGMILGPVDITVDFYLPRPRRHHHTGRYAHLLRDDAPLWPTALMDLDKLLRSTLDGLTTAGAIEDDSLVVIISAAKHYADAREPGATIRVRGMDALEVETVGRAEDDEVAA